jgi:hypothetical protein
VERSIANIVNVTDSDDPLAAYLDDPRPIQRPSVKNLIWYCYGGSLPPENHTWVLHDVTCRTWVLRHFARWSALILPLFVLYEIFMPTTGSIRLYTGITYSLGIYVLSLVFIMIDTDRRAVRAGYPHSLPQAIRTAAGVQRQRASNYERRERIAARQARRR